MMTAKFYGATDIGCWRENNEDVCFVDNIWDDRHILAIAIDGVGGYNGGEVAARVAAQTINFYLDSLTPAACSGETLNAAIVTANNEIVARQRASHLSHMGCVLSAALIDLDARRLYICHIGDSRIYMLVGDKITKLTRDQSPVGVMEDSGELSESQAMRHPRRNLIHKFLGQQHLSIADDYAYNYEQSLEPCTLLLCSDGLSDLLPSQRMAEHLMADGDEQSKVDALIQNAKDVSGDDNITAIVVTIAQ